MRVKILALSSSLVYISGQLGIGQLSMQAKSMIEHEAHFSLIASDIMMRFSSKVTATQITIDTGSIHQEGEATLDVSALGGTANEGDGGVLADSAGIGGGHGGFGGGADDDDYQTGTVYTA